MKTKKAKILFTLFITVNLLVGSSFYLASGSSAGCCDETTGADENMTLISDTESYHKFSSPQEYYNYLMMLHHCKGMTGSTSDHTSQKDSPHKCPYLHHLMECYSAKEQLLHKKFMMDHGSVKTVDVKSVKNAETVPAEAEAKGGNIIDNHHAVIAVSLQLLNSIFLI